MNKFTMGPQQMYVITSDNEDKNVKNVLNKKLIKLVHDTPLIINCLHASLPSHFVLQLSHIKGIQKFVYLDIIMYYKCW